MTLLRGRRYNRAEKHQGARTDRTSDQNDPKSLPVAERLAGEHGVSAGTVKRAGAYVQALEKLGLMREAMAGEVTAPRQRVVQVAKTYQSAML